MEASKSKLYEILKNERTLKVPFFQRSYVWTAVEWERLVKDIDDIITSKREYLMGPIILKQQTTRSNEEVGDVREIIDGQQRLTTIAILFKCLADKFSRDEDDRHARFFRDYLILSKKPYSPIITHNYNDEDTFKAIIKSDPQDDLEKNKNINLDNQVYKCYKYLKAEVENRNWTYDDCEQLTSKILFVGIDLNKDDENEQQIFDTINSIGVSLTTGELIKNLLFSRQGKELYEDTWQTTFEGESKEFWEHIVGARKYKRFNLDLFL